MRREWRTRINTREIKRIKEILINEFGYFLTGDFAYLMNEKNRLFVVNKDLARIDLKKLRIDRIGLYFAEVKNSQVRLSKEGTQLLAQEAKKDKKQLNNEIKKEEKSLFKHLIRIIK